MRTQISPISSVVKKLTPHESESLLKLLEKDEAKSNPISLIEDGHLSIKTKVGTLERLVLNKAQKHILNIIKVLLSKNKPIRLIILKGRQLGCSTLIEAILYSLTSQKPNINSFILADDKDGSNYLFEMSKLYQEKCPAHIRPAEKRSNEKKLEFDKMHSQILIDTAENKKAGREITIQYAHLSEYARFPYPAEVMLGLSQAVPSLPGTMIIKESTANGFNFFKTEWDKAVNKENDYMPIFIPWYWDEGYRMEAIDFKIGDSLLGEISKGEAQLSTQMRSEGINFVEERLMWRRWCIKNNCEGKVVLFQQEHPSTPDEAFIASGDCAFDKEQLVKMLRKNIKPIAVGNIVKDDYKHVFRAEMNGDFRFYRALQPRSSEEYIVTGDACSGSGKDYAVLVALSKRANAVIATFRAKVDSDELAFKAAQIGAFLHNAEVAIENNSYGSHANLKLRSIYANVYKQEKVDNDSGEISESYGWNTNSTTRPDMLGELKEDIRNACIDLNDEQIIRECLTFIKNPDTGKEEAQAGANDDFVIATAIAASVRRRRPFVPVEKEYKQNKRVMADY